MKEWLPAGTVIAHFRISSRVSANGTGEVYQATETSSGAESALKLLPAALVEDLQARQRFVQTFALVAQLRHHNFCQIYEAGVTEEGRPFIAMEYLQGQSLDLVILNHRLSISEIIPIIAQIAEALDGLHERGWLHLRLKPADLMFTSDGRVKILDFGLGMTFPLSLAGDGAGNLRATPATARYLSPEQVMGEPADRRSDVFSLGAVFYELLAGRPAFTGSSVDEALAAVTLATPPPVIEFREDASPALNEIVMKALAKDPGARYQTMGDLARDLRNLPETETMLAPGREARTVIPRSERREDGEGERLPPGSIIEDLKKAFSRLFESKPQRQKALLAKTGLEDDRSLLGDIAQFWKLYRRYILASLLALVGMAMAVVIAGTLRDRFSGAGERAMSVAHATTNGKVANVAISPDGELLVYAVDEAAGQSLWLKELKAAKETRLAQAQPVEYSGLTFAPDGDSITYLKTPFDSGSGAVFKMAARGGAERRLPITGAISPVSFSPDGKRLAAIRTNDDGSETRLWIGDEGGAGEVLSVKRGPEAFQSAPPAWSPDGRVIVCAARDAGSDLFLRLVAIGVADRNQSEIASGRWSEIDGMAWLADGRGLVVSASDPVTRRSQLWQVEYSSNGEAGEVSRVTRDLSDYRGVSLTRDSSLLASAQIETLSNIWVAPNANGDRLRQITTGRQDGVNGIAWTPDGRLIYASLTGDREGLWMSERRVEENNEESRHLPLPTESGDGGQYQPAVSPDGRFAVYVIERAGGAFLLRNEIERREFNPLTEDRLAFFPQFSPDGRWIIYSANRGGRGVVARVPSDGGAAETLIAGRAWRAVASPDGTKLAFNYLDETTARWKLAVASISGGAPEAIFDAPGSMGRVVQWTPDGAGLAFVVTRGGVSNVWSQPVSGGAPAPITNFKTDRIFNFAWSRDGKQLAMAHGWASSDVALIRNFR